MCLLLRLISIINSSTCLLKKGGHRGRDCMVLDTTL